MKWLFNLILVQKTRNKKNTQTKNEMKCWKIKSKTICCSDKMATKSNQIINDGIDR